MPRTAPSDWFSLLSGDQLHKIVQGVTSPLVRGKYLHWDELWHREPPHGLSREHWWAGLKLHRQSNRKEIPLLSTTGRAFSFVLPDSCDEILHTTTLRTGGVVKMPAQVTDDSTRHEYAVSSLIEEAITSSQLEGATTTRTVAKEMILTGRSPISLSERMILNNYRTMTMLAGLRDVPLTKDLVFEIHRTITDGTLDKPGAGRFRLKDEPVVVTDQYQQVFHVPPDADDLDGRMRAMCSFANATEPFVNPIVRSIALHFWLAYDHPFLDGNGRTARALFYWSMLKHGYWLFEYLSISRILRQAPAQYSRAFLHTETDERDLTYFLIHQLNVIERATKDLHEYIRRKVEELERDEANLSGLAELNLRQRSLVSHALRHPTATYTIKGHETAHRISYATARADLVDLESRRLLKRSRAGRRDLYRPADGLSDQLSRARRS